MSSLFRNLSTTIVGIALFFLLINAIYGFLFIDIGFTLDQPASNPGWEVFVFIFVNLYPFYIGWCFLKRFIRKKYPIVIYSITSAIMVLYIGILASYKTDGPIFYFLFFTPINLGIIGASIYLYLSAPPPESSTKKKVSKKSVPAELLPLNKKTIVAFSSGVVTLGFSSMFPYITLPLGLFGIVISRISRKQTKDHPEAGRDMAGMGFSSSIIGTIISTIQVLRILF